MKKLIIALLSTVAMTAQAETLLVQGTVPAGTNVQITVAYQSTVNSFLCTRLVLEDFKRVPKIFDINYKAASTVSSFSATAPTSIEKCNSELISLPSVEVTFPGTISPSQLGFKGEAISIQQSQNNVTEAQPVQCKKVQTGKGLITSCSGSTVYMGPDLTVNLRIEE